MRFKLVRAKGNPLKYHIEVHYSHEKGNNSTYKRLGWHTQGNPPNGQIDVEQYNDWVGRGASVTSGVKDKIAELGYILDNNNYIIVWDVNGNIYIDFGRYNTWIQQGGSISSALKGKIIASGYSLDNDNLITATPDGQNPPAPDQN